MRGTSEAGKEARISPEFFSDPKIEKAQQKEKKTGAKERDKKIFTAEKSDKFGSRNESRPDRPADDEKCSPQYSHCIVLCQTEVIYEKIFDFF